MPGSAMMAPQPGDGTTTISSAEQQREAADRTVRLLRAVEGEYPGLFQALTPAVAFMSFFFCHEVGDINDVCIRVDLGNDRVGSARSLCRHLEISADESM